MGFTVEAYRQYQEGMLTREEFNTLTGGAFLCLPEHVAGVKAIKRLQPVLVRCGGGRFSCPVQDLDHFVDIIGADGRDYVRDVSII